MADRGKDSGLGKHDPAEPMRSRGHAGSTAVLGEEYSVLPARRRALGALAAGACLLVVRPARATFEEMAAALRDSFGERPIRSGKVTLTMPRLAENGSVVPVTVSVDSPMTPQEYVRAIHLFAPQNHLPQMVEFQLGPHNGKAQVSSRVRLARSQQITAVAEMSDGMLWAAVADVEVVASECGL